MSLFFSQIIALSAKLHSPPETIKRLYSYSIFHLKYGEICNKQHHTEMKQKCRKFVEEEIYQRN